MNRHQSLALVIAWSAVMGIAVLVGFGQQPLVLESVTHLVGCDE